MWANKKNKAGQFRRNPPAAPASDLEDARELDRKTAMRLAESEARCQQLSHTNRVLLGIRNVSQIIVSETDPRRLIERACQELTKNLGYFNVWIALAGAESARALGLPEERAVGALAANGFGKGFASLEERLGAGTFPACMQRALMSDEVILVSNPASDCPDCPVSQEYEGRAAMVCRLFFDGMTYGILTASVPAAYAETEEERHLFKELVDDLSFALHKIATTRRLTESRRRYRELFEHSRDGFVMTDENGRILDANHAFCAMLGISLEELRALPNDLTITPKRWHEWESGEIRRNRLLKWGYSGVYEKEYFRRDGSPFPVEMSFYTVRRENGEIDYLWGTVRDISDRKQAEDVLRRERQRLGLVIEGSGLGTWEWNVQTGETVLNKTWASMLGYDLEELSPTRIDTWIALTHPEDYEKAKSLLALSMQGDHPDYRCELRMKHKDGSWIWILDQGRVMTCDERGVPLWMFGTHTDITEYKERQERLALLGKMLDEAPAGITIHDTEGRFLFSNRQNMLLHGYDSEEEFLALNLHRLDEPESEAMLAERFRKIADKGEARFEVQHFHKNGSTFPLEVTAKAIDWHGLPAVLSIAIDITERKLAEMEREKLQAQLNQAQKMESVGRLAGGVAHDFNNMLGVILGHADMMLKDLGPDSPFRSRLEQIRKAAERSANLTRQLLAFARKQTVAPKVLDMNQTIASMLKILERLIGEDIELLWKPGIGLFLTCIDPGQIDQMLANLVVNARDAIGHDHGKIIIETDNSRFDENYCVDHPGFAAGEYAMLAVSDNGCGMDKETLSHLFEPFFTTKELGKGTGLGLAMVYGIVRQNNGFVHVYSEPGRGTSFRIYLPRHQDQKSSFPENKTPEPRRQNQVTVLLVEDEPAILKMTSMMLRRDGHRVLTAGSPKEALRRVKEHSGEIHLLITDVVMPEMNGRELARQISSAYPDLKCLFMSGYTADVIAHHGVLDEGVNFIQKPFSIEGLMEKIHQVLSPPPSERSGDLSAPPQGTVT